MSAVAPILEKALDGERITDDEGVALLATSSRSAARRTRSVAACTIRRA